MPNEELTRARPLTAPNKLRTNAGIRIDQLHLLWRRLGRLP